jgi:hypothetical protein
MSAVPAPDPMVPYGADQTVYVVTDNCGATQSGNRAVECSDIETVITDLLAGKFRDPVLVTAFNTLEHWSQDLSAEVAREIEARCDIDGVPVPEHVRDFLELHTGGLRMFA